MLPVLPVHRALVGIGPVYLKKFLSFKESGPYNLRSNASCELKVPKTKCETHGDRAFSHLLAPHCGKRSLQLSGVSSVQGFKQALKTFWFRLAFAQWTNWRTVIAMFYFHFLKVSVMFSVQLSAFVSALEYVYSLALYKVNKIYYIILYELWKQFGKTTLLPKLSTPLD